MFKTQIIGHLGHDNKLFDVQCKEHGVLNGKEANGVCPKCQQPVVSITTSNGRAMAISEGTIYPTRTKVEEDNLARNLERRKNAMPPMYRFVLFSFAHPETGVLTEPPVHQYLAKGREVLIEVNSEPINSSFTGKDNVLKCETRYVIIPSAGDKIKLLGRKEVVTQPDQPGQPVTQPGVQPGTRAAAPPTNDVGSQIAALQAGIAALVAAQSKPTTDAKTATDVQASLFPTDDDDVPF